MTGPGDRLHRATRGPMAGTVDQLDAPFWSTPRELVEHMLDLAGVGATDRLIDLGCGDGRIVIAAAQRGAEALGIDVDPCRIAEAEAGARAAGLEHRAHFRTEDLFETSLAGANVVTLYLVPLTNWLLGYRLQRELVPGSRVVSHAFPIVGWPADEEHVVEGRRVYLWRVPAEADRPAPAPIPFGTPA